MNQRDEDKATYVAFRDRAIAATQGTNINVRHDAAVQVCTGGAFVEAFVWVPNEPQVKSEP